MSAWKGKPVEVPNFLLEIILSNSAVIAFDRNLNKESLPIGKYPCNRTYNPKDEDDEVFMIITRGKALYVRTDYLFSIDKKFWNLSRIEEDFT